MTRQWYFGPATKQSDDNPPYSKSIDVVMFQCDHNPRFTTHGHIARYSFGGYDSLTEALRKAHYQFVFIRRFINLEGETVT